MEAWKALSHRFHGKAPGHKKQELRLRRIEEERKREKMSAGDTPGGMNAAFQERAERMGSAHMVLSGKYLFFAQPVPASFGYDDLTDFCLFCSFYSLSRKQRQRTARIGNVGTQHGPQRFKGRQKGQGQSQSELRAKWQRNFVHPTTTASARQCTAVSTTRYIGRSRIWSRRGDEPLTLTRTDTITKYAPGLCTCPIFLTRFCVCAWYA